MQRTDERREFQRLELDPPLAATLCGRAVYIAEIGVLGARVQHDAPPCEAGELRFAGKEGAEIALTCELVRNADTESALRFVSALGESGDRLRDMLAELVVRELDRTRRGKLSRIEPEIDGDRTVRGTAAGFLSFRLEGGVWHKRRVFLPEQPPVGFTVARTTDGDDLQRLCRVYEVSDDEGRRLIRMFAELSVSEALEIPRNALR